MSDTAPIGLPDAARQLGVPLHTLRRAIRSGRIPAPPHLTATATLPAGWLESAQAAVEADPHALRRTVQQKVPPFARYKGTSAWRKYANRVREYAHYQASASPMEAPSA